MREGLEGALKIRIREGRVCLGGTRLEKVNDLKIDYGGDIPVALMDLDVRIEGLDSGFSNILNEKNPYGKLNELEFRGGGVYIDEELIRYIRKIEIVSDADDGGYSKLKMEFYVNAERVIV